MIRASGSPSRPNWTDRSTLRQKTRRIGPSCILRRRDFRRARATPFREISLFFKMLPLSPHSPFRPEPAPSRPEIRTHFARKKEFYHKDSGPGFSGPRLGSLRDSSARCARPERRGKGVGASRCVMKCQDSSWRFGTRTERTTVSPRTPIRDPEPAVSLSKGPPGTIFAVGPGPRIVAALRPG